MLRGDGKGSLGKAEPGPAAYSPLLWHVARGSAVTRAQLARVTGLSRSSVSQRVDALLESHLITEDGTTPSEGGRPALRLRINAEAGLILTADLGATRARLAISDLGGTELVSKVEDREINQEPD